MKPLFTKHSYICRTVIINNSSQFNIPLQGPHNARQLEIMVLSQNVSQLFYALLPICSLKDYPLKAINAPKN